MKLYLDKAYTRTLPDGKDHTFGPGAAEIDDLHAGRQIARVMLGEGLDPFKASTAPTAAKEAKQKAAAKEAKDTPPSAIGLPAMPPDLAVEPMEPTPVAQP